MSGSANSRGSRKKSVAKHRNILPNTYVPFHLPKVLTSVLNRLAKTSAVALVLLWPTLKNTQPVRPTLNALALKKNISVVMSQADFNRQVRETAKEMKNRKWTKTRVIDAILYEFWPQGLNLLQLAQVDCQLIVDNPNAYLWISSTVKNAWGKEVVTPLDPPVFLDRLAAQLSKLFLCYIYVCTHPTFPLVLIRIQVFDLTPSSGEKRFQGQPLVSSHRPYFLAVPMSLPHIIHSPGDDLVSQTVLQVVESCLSRGPSEVLHLETSPHQKPIRSLHSMQILKGSSRFAHSLGAWIPYADGEADISPLARHEHHSSVVAATLKSKRYATDEERLQKLANLRFKGSVTGKISSESLYDDPKTPKRRKLDVASEDVLMAREKTPYASLVPVGVVEFELQEPFPTAGSSKDNPPTSHVKLKFVGTDVFAGMHEISLSCSQSKESFVDLEALPGWLTGEEGSTGGIIRNKTFYPRDGELTRPNESSMTL